MKIVPDRSVTNRAFAWLMLGVIALTVFAACVIEDDLTPTQRAYTLDRELMCPVCNGQTIDQSNAQIATDMKKIVRERIAEGESNQEIRDYFVARYGEVILAAPEASGFNLLVWLMPVVIAGGGGLAVVWVLKNMRRRSAEQLAAAPNITLEVRQLKQYLDKVDAHIGNRRAPNLRTRDVTRQESGNE